MADLARRAARGPVRPGPVGGDDAGALQLRWFSRPPLLRAAPSLQPGRHGHAQPPAAPSSRSSPSATSSGRCAAPSASRVARLFGVSEELSIRLDRIHSTDDVTGFRVRQVGRRVWPGSALARCSSSPSARRPPVALLFLLSGPLLGFLIPEQQVASGLRRLAPAARPRAAGRSRAAGHAPVGGVLPRRAPSTAWPLGAVATSPATWHASAAAFARASPRLRRCGSGPRWPTSKRGQSPPAHPRPESRGLRPRAASSPRRPVPSARTPSAA